MELCEWCGGTHPREALCTQRPKWSRRGFLALCGIGIAGALLPALPSVDPIQRAVEETFGAGVSAVGVDTGTTYKLFQVRLTYDSKTGVRIYDAAREVGQKAWMKIEPRVAPASVRRTGIDATRMAGREPDFQHVTEWTAVPSDWPPLVVKKA